MQIDWFPLWLSLRVAVFSTLIALLAGLWIAYLLANRRFRGKDILDALVTLPLVLPPTVLGYYLLVALGRQSHLGRIYEWITGSPLVFTWQAAVVAALFPALPLVIKPARAAFEGLDRSYGRAARSLGASEWRVFWRVTLPLAWRSVLAASVLAFARCLGEFGATIMIAGNIPHKTQTLSVAIYTAVESNRGALARTLVIVISVIALIIVWCANRFGSRQATG